MRRSHSVIAASFLLLGACGPRDDGVDAAAGYGLGHAAPDSLVKAMDHEISPDGAELPPGRGTVAEGAVLYAAQCASCHGAKGEGMGAALPALVGRDPKAESFNFGNEGSLTKTIGNYWPHATTLFDYIKRAMPLTAPGSLTDDQTYALSAYLLAMNDVIPDSSTLDAAALKAVRMPARDRFVPDDRSPSRP